jgi:hypothetical protein
MALTILNEEGLEITWNINNKIFFPYLTPKSLRIVRIIANGEELEVIKKRFVNLPHCHQITTWRGEMAQFIYDNL